MSNNNEYTTKRLEALLQELDGTMAELMLEDIQDGAKRSPQLYNAANKLLERHKFNINKVAPDEDVLNDLAEYIEDIDEDELLDNVVPLI